MTTKKILIALGFLMAVFATIIVILGILTPDNFMIVFWSGALIASTLAFIVFLAFRVAELLSK